LLKINICVHLISIIIDADSSNTSGKACNFCADPLVLKTAITSSAITDAARSPEYLLANIYTVMMPVILWKSAPI